MKRYVGPYRLVIFALLLAAFCLMPSAGGDVGAAPSDVEYPELIKEVISVQIDEFYAVVKVRHVYSWKRSYDFEFNPAGILFPNEPSARSFVWEGTNRIPFNGELAPKETNIAMDIEMSASLKMRGRRFFFDIPLASQGKTSETASEITVRMTSSSEMFDISASADGDALYSLEKPVNGATINFYVPAKDVAGVKLFSLEYSLAGLGGADVFASEGVTGDGYFTAMVAPAPEPKVDSNIVFVLDASSSMAGGYDESRNFLQSLVLKAPPEASVAVLVCSNVIKQFRKDVRPGMEPFKDLDVFLNSTPAFGGTDFRLLSDRLASLKDGRVDNHLFLVTDGVYETMFPSGEGLFNGYTVHPVILLPLNTLEQPFAGLSDVGLGLSIQPRNVSKDMLGEFMSFALSPRIAAPIYQSESKGLSLIYPTKLPDIVPGEPVFISGRYAPGEPPVFKVKGMVDGQVWTSEFKAHRLPAENGAFVRRMWAERRYAEMLTALPASAKDMKFIAELTAICADSGMQYPDGIDIRIVPPSKDPGFVPAVCPVKIIEPDRLLTPLFDAQSLAIDVENPELASIKAALAEAYSSRFVYGGGNTEISLDEMLFMAWRFEGASDYANAELALRGAVLVASADKKQDTLKSYSEYSKRRMDFDSAVRALMSLASIQSGRDREATMGEIAAIYSSRGMSAESMRISGEVALDSSDPALFEAMGDDLENTGDLKRSVEAYGKALALSPRWEKPGFAKGYVAELVNTRNYFDKSEFERALFDFVEVLEDELSKDPAIDMYGPLLDIYSMMSSKDGRSTMYEVNKEAALTEQRIVLPDRMFSQLLRAEYLLRDGDRDGAVELISACMLDPDDPALSIDIACKLGSVSPQKGIAALADLFGRYEAKAIRDRVRLGVARVLGRSEGAIIGIGNDVSSEALVDKNIAIWTGFLDGIKSARATNKNEAEVILKGLTNDQDCICRDEAEALLVELSRWGTGIIDSRLIGYTSKDTSVVDPSEAFHDLAVFPSSAQYMLGFKREQAIQAVIDGQPEGALGQFSEFLLMYPSDDRSSISAGELKMSFGDLKGAFGFFDKACIAKPSDPKGYRLSGIALAEMGDIDGAVSYWSVMAALDPTKDDNPRACLELMLNYGAFDQVPDMVRKFRRGSELKDEFAFELARALDMQGKTKQATKEFVKCLRDDSVSSGDRDGEDVKAKRKTVIDFLAKAEPRLVADYASDFVRDLERLGDADVTEGYLWGLHYWCGFSEKPGIENLVFSGIVENARDESTLEWVLEHSDLKDPAVRKLAARALVEQFPLNPYGYESFIALTSDEKELEFVLRARTEYLPDEPEHWTALVDYVFGKKGFDSAAVELESAYKALPSNPRLVRYHAELLARTGDDARAIDLMERHVAAQPDDAKLCLSYAAELKMKAYEFDQAKAYLRRIMELKPDHIEASLPLAEMAIQTGDSATLGELALHWSQSGRLKDYSIAISNIYIKKGAPSSAKAVLQIVASELRPDEYVEDISGALKAGYPDLAADLLALASSRPDFGKTVKLLDRGSIGYMNADPSSRIAKDFMLAKMEHSDLRPSRLKGLPGEFIEALSLAATARYFSSGMAPRWARNCALLAMASGNNTEACFYLDRFLEAEPSALLERCWLAECYEKIGSFKYAAMEYNKFMIIGKTIDASLDESNEVLNRSWHERDMEWMVERRMECLKLAGEKDYDDHHRSMVKAGDNAMASKSYKQAVDYFAEEMKSQESREGAFWDFINAHVMNDSIGSLADAARIGGEGGYSDHEVAMIMFAAGRVDDAWAIVDRHNDLECVILGFNEAKARRNYAQALEYAASALRKFGWDGGSLMFDAAECAEKIGRTDLAWDYVCAALDLTDGYETYALEYSLSIGWDRRALEILDTAEARGIELDEKFKGIYARLLVQFGREAEFRSLVDSVSGSLGSGLVPIVSREWTEFADQFEGTPQRAQLKKLIIDMADTAVWTRTGADEGQDREIRALVACLCRLREGPDDDPMLLSKLEFVWNKLLPGKDNSSRERRVAEVFFGAELALAKGRMGRWGDALETLDAVTPELKYDGYWRFVKASCLDGAGRGEEAADLYLSCWDGFERDRGIDWIDEPTRTVVLKSIERLFELGEVSKAIELSNKVARGSFKDGQTLVPLAETLAGRGFGARAEYLYEAALRTGRGDPKGYMKFAEANGLYSKALSLWDRKLSMSPWSQTRLAIRSAVIRIMIASGGIDVERVELERRNNARLATLEERRRLAEICLQTGRVDEAMRICVSIFADYPFDADARVIMLGCRRANGSDKEARLLETELDNIWPGWREAVIK